MFSERLPFLFVTFLNGKRARDVTFAIIETFFKVRNLKRDLVKMHKETDKKVQTTIMKQFGEVLTDIVMPDLETSETESSLEINFLIGKLKHSVKRVKKQNDDK